ncbi:MAG TPA: sugar-transfer associated ATP-grasp domain-containing protein [Candidatus Absconditabacterales bacterium]|nr:sugar-transfer associated ATP-grasp domain-containing protein [Candidatus Absconditabacterales bacterium]
MNEYYDNILTKYNQTIGSYLQWLSNLFYCTNKQEFVGEDVQQRYLITPGLWGIINAMEEHKQPYYIDQYGYHLRTQLPNGSIKHCYGYDYGINNASVHRVFDDKIICGKILYQAGFHTPESFLIISNQSKFSGTINNRTALEKWLSNKSFPLIVKPINGSQGEGVHKIMTLEQLQTIVDQLNEGALGSMYLMIQPLISGKDIRVIYLDGTIELAYERIPAHIIGNGIHSIQELYLQAGMQEQQEPIELYLHAHGINSDSILPSGTHQQLLPTANISTGGSVKSYHVTPEDKQFIKHLAKTLDAVYFGADIITTGSISEGTIIELNKMPGLSGASRIDPNIMNTIGSNIWKYIQKQSGTQ